MSLFKVALNNGKFTVEQVYKNKNMVNHHGGVVKVGDYLYGYSDGKGLVCQNFLTGDIVWGRNATALKRRSVLRRRNVVFPRRTERRHGPD